MGLAEVKSQSKGATEMKMTEEQNTAYKAYRKECRMSNVEPVRTDLLMGEIPGCVRYQLELHYINL
jgi:hypothetical protein